MNPDPSTSQVMRYGGILQQTRIRTRGPRTTASNTPPGGTPDPQPHRSSLVAAPASAKVLAIPELLEQVLLHVARPDEEFTLDSEPFIQIWCNCRLVNKAWKSIIETSPKIKRVTFRCGYIDPSAEYGDISICPIAIDWLEKFIRRQNPIITDQAQLKAERIFSNELAEMIKVEGVPEDLYFTYPPTRKLSVSICWSLTHWQILFLRTETMPASHKLSYHGLSGFGVNVTDEQGITFKRCMALLCGCLDDFGFEIAERFMKEEKVGPSFLLHLCGKTSFSKQKPPNEVLENGGYMIEVDVWANPD
ncbi:hypothetical protein H072_6687 [Dactylellina haptotyla CBS 200.50]|uniref:Uncharacterized protein n=1 Tax=Dactylellina haptotyla (strain CBS 200.50) TaxID=1284197 RepID=S8BJR7_DACHA|nr:hypothetical protein H072_6687 [Dactylellina haptotyla CBS 200.50]